LERQGEGQWKARRCLPLACVVFSFIVVVKCDDDDDKMFDCLAFFFIPAACTVTRRFSKVGKGANVAVYVPVQRQGSVASLGFEMKPEKMDLE
jgi:hypothetical protein